ncbi:aarf domain-containing kinase [Nannochloropsis oceanica]
MQMREGGREGGRNWGEGGESVDRLGRVLIGEMYSLLAAILTSRSWDDITSPDLGSLRAPSSQEDKTLTRSYAQRYYFEIVEILNSVPWEMLLLLKMNDCLRHVDRELGAPVNSSLVTAEEAVKALLREELKAGAREGGRAGWGKKGMGLVRVCELRGKD